MRTIALCRPLLTAAALAVACDGGGAPARDLAVRSGGPVVESVPSPLARCAPEPRPTVRVVEVPGAPVALSVVRAYHVCLGEYAALLRFEARSSRPITQVVLERRWWDVRGQRRPRIDRDVLTRGFERGAVRYHRVRWREGIANRGERAVEIRLRLAHHREGPPFDAGPFPAGPPPPGVPPPAPGLSDKLGGVRRRVQSAAEQIRSVTRRLEEHPLVRHRPRRAPDAGAP